LIRVGGEDFAEQLLRLVVLTLPREQDREVRLGRGGEIVHRDGAPVVRLGARRVAQPLVEQPEVVAGRREIQRVLHGLLVVGDGGSERVALVGLKLRRRRARELSRRFEANRAERIREQGASRAVRSAASWIGTSATAVRRMSGSSSTSARRKAAMTSSPL
jgi:hypothetical protein